MYELLASKAGRVHVCGHRGHCIDRPENTMAAFCRAVEFGCTSLEIDVVLSGDGDIVVLHDITVDRTTKMGSDRKWRRGSTDAGLRKT